jgi:hypothetical protein
MMTKMVSSKLVEKPPALELNAERLANKMYEIAMKREGEREHE